MPIIGLIASQAQRFPSPQFEGDYTPPIVTPVGRDLLWEHVDVFVLLLTLLLASWLTLRIRKRRWIAVLMMFSLVYFGFWRTGCVCSVGAVGNVTRAFMDSNSSLPLSVVAFFMLPLVFTLFFGRGFCGAVCPLGAVQDLVLVWPLRIPSGLERSLRLCAYLFLGLVVLFAATGGAFLICQYDPFAALFWREGLAIQWILAGIVVILSLVVARPYCRFLCPYGILLRQMSRLSKWRITVTPNICINCRSCEKACPVGAIRKTTQQEPNYDHATNRRWPQFLVVLLPFMVALGVVLGAQFQSTLARMHPAVRRAQVKVEEATEFRVYSEEGQERQGPSQASIVSAQSLLRRFHLGTQILGGWLFLVIGLKLIFECLHQRHEGYEADRADCLACGRCFAYCPKEQRRRQDKSLRRMVGS